MRIPMAIALLALAGCAHNPPAAPSGDRCITQDPIILTVEEAAATPSSVTRKIATSNCALYLACDNVYEVPPACRLSP